MLLYVKQKAKRLNIVTNIEIIRHVNDNYPVLKEVLPYNALTDTIS